MITLTDLIVKRHEGSGWQVFTELPNGTGGRATRRADALAFGLWPSHRYEVHGYEIKQSRGDVRRELQDISKSDALGRFCDYWSLVVADLAIIKELLIPPTWGILVPERSGGTLGPQSRLRVHRKPAKRKAEPMTRAFVAAMFQYMSKMWVSRVTHTRLVDRVRELETQRGQAMSEDAPGLATEQELLKIREAVARFERESGIPLVSDVGRVAPWIFGDIGAAVRVVLDANAQHSRTKQDVSMLERYAENLKAIAERAGAEAAALRAVLEMKHAPQDATREPDPAQENAVPSEGPSIEHCSRCGRPESPDCCSAGPRGQVRSEQVQAP